MKNVISKELGMFGIKGVGEELTHSIYGVGYKVE